MVELLSDLSYVAVAGVAFGVVMLVNPGGRRGEINKLLALEIAYGSLAAYLWLKTLAYMLTGDHHDAFSFGLGAAFLTIWWWFFHRLRKDKRALFEGTGYKHRAVLAKIAGRMRAWKPRLPGLARNPT